MCTTISSKQRGTTLVTIPRDFQKTAKTLRQFSPPNDAFSFSPVPITATTPTALLPQTSTPASVLSAEVELAHFAPAGVVHERAIAARTPLRR